MAAQDVHSKWSKALESRLGKLTESSSKESFQTVARWMIFHRKHIEDFKTPIRSALSKALASSVVISVLHALFLAYKGKTEKWNKLADMRVQIAEQCLVDAQTVISTRGVAALKSHLDDWDSNSCFGGPVLVHLLKRKLNQDETSSSKDTEPVEAGTESPGQNVTSVTELAEDEPTIDANEDAPLDDNPSDSLSRRTESGMKDIQGSDVKKRKVSFGDDRPGSAKRNRPVIPEMTHIKFEELDITERSVDASELMDPCRTIATLQIARDLRAESVLRLSTLLQELPEEVRAIVVESAETGNIALDDKAADELSRLVSDELLDLDVKQQVASVRNYRALVEQQNAARLSVIRLLQECRCKFGAKEIAEAYYNLTDVKHYNDQSQQLVDMLDLEGLDMETVLANEEKLDEADQAFAGALPPIDWHVINSTDGAGLDG